MWFETFSSKMSNDITKREVRKIIIQRKRKRESGQRNRADDREDLKKKLVFDVVL